ncbi:MAG: hypothetical protein K0R09_3073, partial [Clostridiales bacterium]|nr:hypothetical protein [Clostridiales bacterium]
LPPFNGFVSKWLIFKGTYEAGYAPVTIIAILASVLTLVSFIKVAYSIFFGQLSNQYENIGETSLSMRMPMWIMALLCFITGVMPQYITKYLITPAVLAVSNVGEYIDAMMGSGYGEKWFGEPLAVSNLNQTISGYYDPMSWLIIFVVALIAFTLVAGLGGLSHKQASPEDFMNEGNKMPLRRNFNFKYYFILMDKVNSGVVNDYALLVISTTAIILVYLFLFV